METITIEEAPPAPEATEDRPRRLSLRDAVRVCGMSEKTLRRKLEAGALRGQRESLDYGGFMWMIDARSLGELYPSPELDAYLADLPEGEEAESTEGTALAPLPVTQEDAGDFLSYVIEQNRLLRDELKVRDERLASLHDRALELEREVGEQRGTAVTQARVLEWFQQQQQQAPAQPAMLPAPESHESAPAPVANPLRPALLGAVVTVGLTVLLLAASGHFG